MSGKPKVIVDPSFRRMDEIFTADDQRRLYALADVIWGKDEPMPHAQFLQALPDVEAIICADWDRYGDVLPQASKLRGIFTVGGAFPIDFDYDYCFDHRIRVLSVAPSFARQVAEMALGMMICCTREIALGDRAMRRGEEKWLHAGNVGNGLIYGKPVGMIGFGAIARALTPLLRPFDVTISAYDPWLSDGVLRSQGVEPADLATVLKTSQVTFVLAAMTKENKALLSREYLEMIPPGATLVLLSRAHVIDFDALTDLLLAGRFRAAIDVFPQEPMPKDHPIRRAENAVLSAHRAGSVQEGLWEIGAMVLDDLELVLRGLLPQRLARAEPEIVRRYAPLDSAGRANAIDDQKD